MKPIQFQKTPSFLRSESQQQQAQSMWFVPRLKHLQIKKDKDLKEFETGILNQSINFNET